ncbi:HlyD family secretion protein [Chitinophaga qingshengii]|uniref:HlyD family secretion protein n=1 Tax=Chitinophaga qingshengii TaxID=1569794 RepID=A0ABR7TU80_9BACT|nr:HlyD family secretion protein [Chitinophaga qingshengii]MBC9933178.1 HlyD family secretion protein [Chitinophaga qingshengii]
MTKQLTTTDRFIIGLTRMAALLLAAGLGCWGVWYCLRMMRYEETNDAQVEAYINPVSARVSGYIRQICFEENQPVKTGDTLVIIDDRDYRAQANEAMAALDNARAQTTLLEGRINTLKNEAAVSSARIDAAKVRMEHQQQEYKRFTNLLAEESTTRQRFDNVKAALDIATAEYQAALRDHQSALARIEETGRQSAAVAAEIKRREAVADQHQLSVGYTVIRAPYNGRVGRKNIQEGQLIQAGQPLTFISNDETPKWIVANFKETQVQKFRTGQPVNITVDAFPGETFRGEIISLSPATGSRYSLLPPDNATGNFVKIIQRIPVRIRILETPSVLSRLVAGMNANVSVSK